MYADTDLLGFGSLKVDHVYSESAIAVNDTTLYGITNAHFLELIEHNPKLAIGVIQMLTESISENNEHLLDIAYSSVRKKTAKTIIQFAQVLHAKRKEELKISRSDLASVAGITTETMIRTLNDFKREGLIEIEHTHIKLLRLEQLKSID